MYILNHVLSRMEDNILIILGNFNINAFEENKNKKVQVLINYIQILEEPTHISGSLIDQVYIKKYLLTLMPKLASTLLLRIRICLITVL